ncbi:hypothetical protein F4821DRAFT_227046 [Hypoxylon rubiginosum]|uniref:Uncharacterized protein n=1 Tax=Hypoxylon rubiginosum TaxID=110542 RepID=A0ACC0DFT8_9PEZI|nr:hypothetical protein F4821DRAFT_227046 [Hypoxylon rubiginosum]
MPQGGPISPVVTIPATCSTTIDDFPHTTASVKTHECYTYEREAPSPTCPTLSCGPRPTDAICPLYIRVSSVTVPCATDCCPTTTTSYQSTGACPTCADCVVPTQWITYTTGCAGTPTITAETIITPPWNTPTGYN